MSLSDVYISYAHEDAEWAALLVERLRGNGVPVVHDRCSLLPGQVVVHEIEEAIRRSATGIQVLSPAALGEPWLRQEYAALLHASVERGLRLIPVLYGDADLPPFAATRVWVDFRRVTGRAFDDKAAELAREISGAARTGPVTEAFDAARATRSEPLTRPPEPTFVVCYARDDADYGERLAAHLTENGLPTWTIGRLTWGDDYVWTIRRQLRHALALIVLMSSAAQESEDVTREILEGQRHGREFFPVLLDGERHYLLASSWYFDARDGALPGRAELHLLRRLLRGADDGHSAPPPAPPPPSSRPALLGTAPPRTGDTLGRLRACLAEGETEHADLLTTTLLLGAAERQASGWLRRRDGGSLPDALLGEIDAAWSSASNGGQGFRAQRARARLPVGARHADFLTLSVAYGWRGSPGDTVPRYPEFTARASSGFFPTLRNPQCERYVDWYDQWIETVIAVHLRLREWRGETR